MIKPTMFMGLVLVTVLAFAVYQVENRVKNLRGELQEINQQMKQDRETIHVLKAEWAYLNKPERIKEMSERYLDLNYVTAGQVVDLDQIPMRVMADNDSRGLPKSMLVSRR